MYLEFNFVLFEKLDILFHQRNRSLKSILKMKKNIDIKTSRLSGVLFLFFLFVSTLSYAQSTKGTLKGIVYNNTNAPIIGAAVTLKDNSSVGTITDENGRFSLSAPSLPTTLVVVFVGFDKQTIEVKSEAQEIVVKLR